jgi:hypothetical protein
LVPAPRYTKEAVYFCAAELSWGVLASSIAEGSLARKLSLGEIWQKMVWCELSNDLVASLPTHRIPEVATLWIGMETGVTDVQSAVDCGGGGA